MESNLKAKKWWSLLSILIEADFVLHAPINVERLYLSLCENFYSTQKVWCTARQRAVSKFKDAFSCNFGFWMKPLSKEHLCWNTTIYYLKVKWELAKSWKVSESEKSPTPGISHVTFSQTLSIFCHGWK